MEEHKCPLCDSNLNNYNFSNNLFYMSCPTCGQFYIERDNISFLGQILGKVVHNNPLYFNTSTNDKELKKLCGLLSSYVYELNNKNKETYMYPTVNEELIKRLFNSSIVPKTPEEKVNKILNTINNKTEQFGEHVSISPTEVYLINQEELKALIKELERLGFIDSSIHHGNDPWGSDNTILYSITLKGLQYIKTTRLEQKRDKCFVAMWFNPSMETVFDEAISPACKEAGFFPVRIDKKEHNNDINDEIIKEINSSSFVIADLTGFRGGVYYEAGYARGLGKEVILCCKDKYKIKVKYPENNNKLAPEEGPHFDVNHINTIYWKEGKLDLLKDSLYNRILATFGQGEYMEETNA